MNKFRVAQDIARKSKMARGIHSYLQSRTRRPQLHYYEFPSSCQIPNLGFIYEFFFGKEVGGLIEIGAYDGYTFSNSCGLIEKGWNAHLYEPLLEFNSLLLERYKIKQMFLALGRL